MRLRAIRFCRLPILYSGLVLVYQGPNYSGLQSHSVDPDFFSPSFPEMNESDPVILSVGNLIPIKGHDLAIRAVAALAEKYPSIRIEIIGEGPERDYLSSVSRNLGIQDRVRFLGRKSRLDVSVAMKRCAIFMLLSRYEGLGCVYLEALASAKPVIACRGQGIEDVIRNGQNGFLVDPDDPGEAIRVMSSLLADKSLRRTIGNNGRRTVLQHLLLLHQAEHLCEIYRDCLKINRSR